MQDLDSVYREYAKTVYKFLLTKTQNSEWAEELTQETFYRALHSLHTYDGTCKMSTWLCQIAKHVFLQELNKKKKHEADELSDDIPSAEKGTEAFFIDSEQKIELLTALHRTKEPFREILYLRLFGDLSFKEIGEILGQTETWARVNFYRGKKMILEILS